MIFVPLILSFTNFSTALLDSRPKYHRGSKENLTYDDLSGRMLSYQGLTASPVHLLNFSEFFQDLVCYKL